MKSTVNFLSILMAASFLFACESNANSANADANAQQDSVSSQSLGENNKAVALALQENLSKSGVDISVQSAVKTPMQGIYWVDFNDAPSMFTDETGTYVIRGEIIALGGDRPVDIAANMRSQTAKKLLAEVPTDEMIVIPAKNEHKATIYVFTDPTCHYCQKLHSEIEQTTLGGVEVRYLAWPRNQSAIPLAQSIWCSKDRLKALTQAKQGNKPSSQTCQNPVEKHLALGESLGVTGTPAIFTESGLQIGGYLPSNELVKIATTNK